MGLIIITLTLHRHPVNQNSLLLHLFYSSIINSESNYRINLAHTTVWRDY